MWRMMIVGCGEKEGRLVEMHPRQLDIGLGSADWYKGVSFDDSYYR